MSVSVLLIDPRFPHNVGAALRACAVLGGDSLAWTGTRVSHPDLWEGSARLPREERMKDYKHVSLALADEYEPSRAYQRGLTPVCVEVSDHAEDLIGFVHPDEALYVFGPEDGHVPRGVRGACHRFVCIPTTKRTPLNLAAAVNVVLYDRLAKARAYVAASDVLSH